MAKQVRAQPPAMSDLAVIAKTGKSWDQWFETLDKAGASKLDHKGIAKLLAETRRVGPWWQQMVAVEYERARGLRAKHEAAGGFSVGVSKTVAGNVAALYAATVEANRRRKWFPAGALKISSLTDNKYFRASWNDNARLEINFTSKPGGKAQIAVQVGKLAKKSDVERERAAWKRALARLESLMGK
ncbi:MAG: hypothetical protein ABSD21_10240 [Rhizomicrobium sp.]|jgi:hypothetical protein